MTSSNKVKGFGSNKVKGFAAGVVAAVCYGTNPLGTLVLYGDGFNSSSVLIYRYLLAVLMFAVVMLFRKESFKVKWVAALFALHHLGEPVEESGHVEHQVHLLHSGVRTHHDTHLFVHCGREDSDAANSGAMGLCRPACIVANGIVAFLHDHLHQSHRQHASRHHGSLGACNGGNHRRLHFRREFHISACHRHPRHPCWCHDYYCQEEIR